MDPTATSLDTDLATFDAALRAAAELVIRIYGGLDDVRVSPARPAREIAALFDAPLPERGEPLEAILREIEAVIVPHSTLSLTPRFFGYINSGGNQAAVVAELVAAAINQICARWHFAPAAAEVEQQVIRWLAEFIGYPAAGGCLVSGGSAGNLIGLAVARQRVGPFDAATLGMGAGPPLVVYASTEAHASIPKAMALLGIGRAQLRAIPVGDDLAIDVAALEKRIEEDRRSGAHPICVVGNAGTTNTGAIDPLDALADVCQRRGLWFHVDAAYGGPAAATRAAGPLFRGLERADSVVVNPHKWLYVPVEAAAFLIRDRGALRDTFRITADYLREDVEAPLDFKDQGPQLSRSFRALKVWMTFKAYGARRLRAAIESNIAIMRDLGDRIDRSPDLVRLAPVPLSVVCFQYRTDDPAVHGDRRYLDALNERLVAAIERDGRVFLSGTTIGGVRALRACSVNHRLVPADVGTLLAVVRELGRSLARAPA